AAAEARQRVGRQDHRGRGPARPLPRERSLVVELPAGPVGAVAVTQVLDAREHLKRLRAHPAGVQGDDELAGLGRGNPRLSLTQRTPRPGTTNVSQADASRLA